MSETQKRVSRPMAVTLFCVVVGAYLAWGIVAGIRDAPAGVQPLDLVVGMVPATLLFIALWGMWTVRLWGLWLTGLILLASAVSMILFSQSVGHKLGPLEYAMSVAPLLALMTIGVLYRRSFR